MHPSRWPPSPGEWLVGAAGRLPEEIGRPLGRGLGALARRPLGLRRRVVEEQIAAVFPERPERWVHDVAARCYRHFGEELLATASVARAGTGALLERVESLDEVRETHRRTAGEGGCVVVTGHLGNWELAGGVLRAFGRPVVAVVRRQEGPAEGALRRLRGRLGIESVPMERAASRLPAALAGGSVVALVADQHAAARGVVVPFLGLPASTFRGPARLALALEVPLLFGALVRHGAGYRAYLEPVAEAAREAREPAGLGERRLTRAWLARLERAIRRHPGQYLWLHRRWKPLPRPEDPGAGRGPELAPERGPGAGGTNQVPECGAREEEAETEAT